jgi:hypothetical protein
LSVYLDFNKNSGQRTKKWNVALFNDILTSGKFPKLFKRAKVITILKPGNDGYDPSYFRPISLLSIVCKILDRTILQRIQPLIAVVSVSQVGLCKNRSCTEQVWRQNIDAVFQRKLKTGVVFIDLTAAYDTVEIYAGRSLYQAVEFTEQYVVKPFLPILSW